MLAVFVETCRCKDPLPANVVVHCSFDVFMEGDTCVNCTAPVEPPEVVDDPRLNTLPLSDVVKMWSRCVRNVEKLPLRLASQYPVLAQNAQQMSECLGALGRKSSMYTEVEPTCGTNQLGLILTDIATRRLNDAAGLIVKVKALDGELTLTQAYVSLGTLSDSVVLVQPQGRVAVIPGP